MEIHQQCSWILSNIFILNKTIYIDSLSFEGIEADSRVIKSINLREPGKVILCFADEADKMMNTFSSDMTEILHDYRLEGFDALESLLQ